MWYVKVFAMRAKRLHHSNGRYFEFTDPIFHLMSLSKSEGA